MSENKKKLKCLGIKKVGIHNFFRFGGGLEGSLGRRSPSWAPGVEKYIEKLSKLRI